MQWKHDDNPCPQKYQTAISTGKESTSVIWDMKGILLFKWLPQGQTVNSDMYCNTLICIYYRIQLGGQGAWACMVLISTTM